MRSIRSKLRPFVKTKGRWLNKISIVVGLFVVFNLLYPLRKQRNIELEEGSIASEDIIAPFTFPILKAEGQFQKERQQAVSAVLPVLVLNSEKTEETLAMVGQYFEKVGNVASQKISAEQKLNAIAALNPMVSESTRDVLVNSKQRDRIRQAVDEFISGILETGVLSSKELIPGSGGKVILKSGAKELQRDHSGMIDLEDVSSEARKVGISHFKYDENLMEAFLELGLLFVQPNLEFSIQEYALRQEEARKSVSRTKGVVLKGEMIVAAHYPVTQEAIEKLKSLEIERERRGGELEYPAIFSTIGRNIIFGALLSLLVLYMMVFKPSALKDDPSLLLLAICFSIVLVLAYVVISIPALPNYMIPVAVAPILIALLLDSELAVLITVVLSLVIGIYTGLRLGETMVSLIAGVVAVFSLRKIRRRTQFYKTILYLSLAYLLGIVSVESLKFTPFSDTLQYCGFGILNSFFSVFLCMGIVPVFERLFGFTTDITLLELSDLNRPILRELSLKAPGTFHHSLVIGSLAESAAESIKANTLLARVGAYYHDIGKVKKPEYFADNQMGMRNPHDKLSPKLSALIISSHVKDGMVIAKREKLPKPIIDIIAEHHGKTLISYFYNKALELNPKQKIEETDFRYPGPRPGTKEAAIVMLADSVEAAARSLENPTPSRLKGIIRQIATNRFNETELDDSDLTMKELHRIGESFLPILVGIFHQRPEYPGVLSENLRRTPKNKKKDRAAFRQNNRETGHKGS